MTGTATNGDCNLVILRAYLEAALIEADKCDPLVAIHVETAIATLDRLERHPDQSSER